MSTEEKIYRHVNRLWILNIIGAITAVLFVPIREVEHSFEYKGYYSTYTRSEYSWETFFIVLCIAIIELLVAYLIKKLVEGFCEHLEAQKEISKNTKDLLFSVKHKTSGNASEKSESMAARSHLSKKAQEILKNDDRKYEGLNDSSYMP